MDQNRIEFIYRKCLTNTATVEEQREFMRLIRLPEHKETTKTILLASFYENQRDVNFDDISAEAMIEAILLSDKDLAIPTADLKSAASSLPETSLTPFAPAHRIHFLKTAWFRYAAILLLIAGTATYLYYTSSFRKNPEVTKAAATPKPQDILPGGNKATLTLSDGTTIILDSAADGNLAQQGNARILKLSNGRIAYHIQDVPDKSDKEVMWNTMRTPAGGQYQVTLPDGTRVWLNAASLLKYPGNFTGADRKVEISGEAYFEIAKDKTRPFFVTINDQAEVKVLGTSFNVNAYEEEESIRTTLLEGSIMVQATGENSSAQTSLTLQPRQQASITTGDKSGRQGSANVRLSNSVDIDQVMAWKNGVFNFEGVKFKEVMRQLERWYNIQVIYEKGVPDIHFEGEISRNIVLTDLLKALEQYGVRFRLEDERRLMVLSAFKR